MGVWYERARAIQYDTGWLNILKLKRRNIEGRARRILPFVAFYPALLEVEANQNHVNVHVVSEHSPLHWAQAVEVPRQGAPGAGGVYFQYLPPHLALMFL